MSKLPDPDIDYFSRGFTLNGWEVRPMAGILVKNGHEIHLEPKVMDVLVCLARHRAEVVTREMLLEEVWAGVIVTDDAVTRCISELRTVLGDTDRERTYIRTIPRRGYSLIAEVGPLEPFRKPENEFLDQVVPENSPVQTPDTSQHVNLQVHNENMDIKRTRNRHMLFVVLLFIFFIVLIVNNADDFSPSIIRSKAGSKDSAQSEETPVQAAQAGKVRNGTDNTGGIHHHIQSIAVLPLANLSDDQENEYIAEGISEDIRNALTSVNHLRVAARTSSTVFKDKAMDVRDIASKLNVDALLEGTVRISNGRLRITVQLTDADDGYSLWAASFERDIEDKIQLQTEIAAEIAKQLVPTISNSAFQIKGVTANVRAQDLYFLGRHYWHKRTPESLKLAVEYFREAIKLDPNYALAYSGLSDALLFQTTYDNRTIEDVEAPARAAVNEAMALEPQLPEAHASLGVLLEQTGNLKEAKQAYFRAVSLNPQNSMAQMWLGNILAEEGKINESYSHYELALKVDPLHPQIQFNFAHSLLAQGRYDEAITQTETFLKFNQNDFIFDILLEAYLETGRYKDVLTLAVGYNISDANKSYKNRAVIETLIHLQRFEEAEKMIKESRETMEPWKYGTLLSELAIARRDPAALRLTADSYTSLEINGEYRKCGKEMRDYYRGISAYMEGDYRQSIEHFKDFFKLTSGSDCSHLDIIFVQSAGLYQAAAYLRGGIDIEKGNELLKQARNQLIKLNNYGWNSTEFAQMEITAYSLMKDYDKAADVVMGMIERGWKPYGMLRYSPLLNDFVKYLAQDGIRKFNLEQDFKLVQQSCNNIGLAKLGI